MQTAKVYKTYRDKQVIKNWYHEIQLLSKENIMIYDTPQKADVHIVLSGKYENPAILIGKRVLFFKESDWYSIFAWKTIYLPIMREYYDEIYCMDSTSFAELVGKIKEYDS